MPRLITLTHANFNTSIHVVADLIFSFYYSETHKATLIMASGGAMFPVKESPEEVSNALNKKAA